MRTRYIDLIDQTFDFPQNEFNLREDRLFFHGIDLMRLINEYGTPLKFNYLPQISNNIQRAKGWFREAINNLGYSGKYHYSYCTKSNHFSFVLDEVMKNDVHIETSSAFDIDIVLKLIEEGKFEKGKFVICNGYKPKLYLDNMVKLMNLDHVQVIPVVDNTDELNQLLSTQMKIALLCMLQQQMRLMPCMVYRPLKLIWIRKRLLRLQRNLAPMPCILVMDFYLRTQTSLI